MGRRLRQFRGQPLFFKTKGLSHPFFQPCADGVTLAVAPRAWREHAHPHEACLLTNNDFSSGTTGWTGTNATLAEAGGILTVTNTGSNGYATQTVTVVSGGIYEISAKFIKNGASTNGQVEAISGANTANSGNLTGDAEVHFNITADGTSLEIRLVAVGAASGVADYDYACIRRIG